MSFDLKAICDALAAKYAAGTIGTPAGATAMRKAYGQIPLSTPSLPAVVVVPQDGEFIADTSPMWHGTQHIDVVFLVGKHTGDTARAEKERQLWLPNLLFAAFSDVDLGQVGDVKSALPATWEFTEYPYIGTEYDAIIIHYDVMVRSSQAWSP